MRNLKNLNHFELFFIMLSMVGGLNGLRSEFSLEPQYKKLTCSTNIFESRNRSESLVIRRITNEVKNMKHTLLIFPNFTCDLNHTDITPHKLLSNVLGNDQISD